METKKLSRIAMNPTRQRIMQCILVKGKASTSEIQEELRDIPQATLYRNIRVLKESNLIKVVEQKAIRGVIERYYSATSEIHADSSQSGECSRMIQGCLLELSRRFNNYFEHPEADPHKDRLCFASMALVLSDEEMDEFKTQFAELLAKYSKNEKTEDRKVRNFTILSVPTNGEK